MLPMQNNYLQLLQKLDEFIRKYYKNQLIRGAIYFTASILISFLLIVILEYFGRYNSTVRAILFYSFASFGIFCLINFLIIPLTKLYHIGKTIDYKIASDIIGKHFPEVKDKLINTLQLKNDAEKITDASLIYAAINQKTEQLKPIPFNAAIDLKKNLRYIKYALIPVLVYIVIYIISPGMITDSSERLLKYNTTFKAKMPFEMIVENQQLQAQQFSDFELKVKISGKEIPEEIFILLNGNSYKMEKKDKLHFSYVMSNLQKPVSFQLQADAFISDDYKIDVVAKPLIVNYQVQLQYPAYINKKNETVNNPGDLTIPAGTVVKWKFITQQTDEILLSFGGSEMQADHIEKDLFTYLKKFFLSGNYTIKNQNAKVHTNDSMMYNINVVPDAFPSITVENNTDSLTGKQVYFIGDASDDYGLTKLTFNYRFIKSEQKEKVQQGVQSKLLPLDKKDKSFRFYHQFNLDEINVEPADEVEYYFEVWDNDGVHAPKSSRSKTMVFKAPSIKELEASTETGNSAMKEKMEEAVKEAQKLQKEMKDLNRKMLEKRELSWEEKKKLDELLERQRELNKKIDEIKKENQRNNEKEAEYKKQNEQILEKQKEIEKMFNEVMNDDMKKMIKELEQMMKQQNKDQIKQEMDKMQLNNKDVEKELDRMLEHFKQLEVEKKYEDALNKLDKIEEKQEQLSKKSEDLSADKKLSNDEKKKANEEIKKEQEELKKQFDELQKELKDVEQKNKELETPKELENTDKEEKDIEQEMKEGEEQLEKSDSKKASQKQKEAAQKMKQMSEKMKKGMKDAEEKELDLDIDALREILENTVQLSKDQEALMDKMKQINGYNPQFVESAQVQKNIKDDAKIIEDSLLALSKKVVEIKSFVNREISKLNDNLDKSVQAFGSRNFGEIRNRQQYSMTHANNLAVMLSEILQQMQEKQSESKAGNAGKKPKPGKGSGSGKGKGKGKGGEKPSFGQMKKMQEELNKQLREGMNKNGSGEEKKPGENGKKGQGGISQQGGMGSEQFARMAAQQMAVRQQMQKMLQQMGSKEKEQLGGTGKLQELQKLMEETEKELFNKKLSGDLLMRQQEILTRLLESEKAERKQEQDNKREAEQAKEKPRVVPPDFEKYIKQKNKEKELLETIPADLQPYYKEKAKEYFNKIGAGN